MELAYVKSDTSKLSKQVTQISMVSILELTLWLHETFSVTSGLKEKYLTLIAEFCVISQYHPKMNGYITTAPLWGGQG